MRLEGSHSRIDAVDKMKEKTHSLIKHLGLACLYGMLGALLLAVTLVVIVLQSRPDLDVWHVAELDAEFTEDSEIRSVQEYLVLEERLFEQLAREVYEQTGPAARYELNRYKRGSPSDPARWPQDWNRTFELTHEDPGAVVLQLHGLSDSPYSLRATALGLHAAGAHVLTLRVPGHGTAPVGLVDTIWKDMAAAVALAVSDLSRRFPDKPLYLVGYSNGAALALHHTLKAIETNAAPVPDGLVLISPEIAVSSAAALAVWQARLGRWLGLDKLAWNSLALEYDPFKYGSFAVAAGDLSHRLTAEVQRQIQGLDNSQLEQVPPILAFTSLVDATVRAPELVAQLFKPLPAGGHELVLFDVNRYAGMTSLLKWRPDQWISRMGSLQDMQYRTTVVTNQTPDSLRVEAREYGASGLIDRQPLDLSWPADVYSLSHVALTFPESDPLYGASPEPESPGISLGNIALRGERGVLQVGDSAMLRQRWNPFFPYLEQRMLQFLDLGPGVVD